MKGDMFIPRGNNEFNIESHIVGFDPEFIWLKFSLGSLIAQFQLRIKTKIKEK